VTSRATWRRDVCSSRRPLWQVAKQDFHTRQAAGADLQEEAEEAHTGFEPVLREEHDEPPLGREPGARPASELPADLQRIVERLTRKRGARESRD
jgi:hypothetical protein